MHRSTYKLQNPQKINIGSIPATRRKNNDSVQIQLPNPSTLTTIQQPGEIQDLKQAVGLHSSRKATSVRRSAETNTVRHEDGGIRNEGIHRSVPKEPNRGSARKAVNKGGEETHNMLADEPNWRVKGEGVQYSPLQPEGTRTAKKVASARRSMVTNVVHQEIAKICNNNKEAHSLLPSGPNRGFTKQGVERGGEETNSLLFGEPAWRRQGDEVQHSTQQTARPQPSEKAAIACRSTATHIVCQKVEEIHNKSKETHISLASEPNQGVAKSGVTRREEKHTTEYLANLFRGGKET